LLHTGKHLKSKIERQESQYVTGLATEAKADGRKRDCPFFWGDPRPPEESQSSAVQL
jgi:hypothetical protein